MTGITTLKLFIENNKALQSKIISDIKTLPHHKLGTNVDDEAFNNPIIHLTDQQKENYKLLISKL